MIVRLQRRCGKWWRVAATAIVLSQYPGSYWPAAFAQPAETEIEDATDDTTPAPPDPIGTKYAKGGSRSDPAVISAAPRAPRFRAFLPEAVDISKSMPRPGDQGQLGSCTSWAVGYAARSYYSRTLEGRDIRKHASIPSPRYLYLRVREDRSTCGKMGSAIPDNVKVLKEGALSLSAFPYEISKTDEKCTKIDAASVSRATDFKVKGLRYLFDAWVPGEEYPRALTDDELETVKGQLAENNPVIISYLTNSSFDDYRGDSIFSSLLPSIKNEDGDLPWHALTLAGYSERRQAFRVINSWGRSWGDRGYMWMSYDVFRKRTREAVVLDPIVPVKPPPEPEPVPLPPPPPSPALNLSKYQCAKLNTKMEGGVPAVEGFLGSEADLEALKKQVADANARLGNVLIAPWPQCETLETLDAALKKADAPKIDIGASATLSQGDPLKIEVKAPGQPAYVYVSYLQADGSVVHLAQPQGLVPKPATAGQKLTFGDGADGRQKFTVTGPFGRELIVVLASRSPLFDTPLESRQTDRAFLSTLRRALIYKADPSLPDRELSAAVIALTTKEASK